MPTKTITTFKAMLLAAVVTAGSAGFAQNQNNDPLLKAKAFLAGGNYVNSAREVDRYLGSHPKNGGAYFIRAIAHTRMDEPDEGLRDFERALQLNPNYQSLSLYDERYRAYIGVGKLNLAISDLTAGIKARPKEYWRYKERGQVYGLLKQYPAAISDMNTAIKLDPTMPLLYLNRGHIYAATGKYDKAVDDYSHVIKAKPNDPMAYGCRAGAYEKLGKGDLARKDRKEADKLGAFQM